MTNTISNSNDVIDSRDVIARIKELNHYLDSYNEQGAEQTEEWEDVDSDNESFRGYLENHDDDGAKELLTLLELSDEAEGYAPDWISGAQLIHDSYFEEYARQLAEDIGAIDSNASWPNNFIDWEGAANALQQDYTSVDFDGETYWVR